MDYINVKSFSHHGFLPIKTIGKLQKTSPNFHPFTQSTNERKKLSLTLPNISFSLTYDHFGSNLPIIPFITKLCHFGLAQNNIVLTILGFKFFFFN